MCLSRANVDGDNSYTSKLSTYNASICTALLMSMANIYFIRTFLALLITSQESVNRCTHTRRHAHYNHGMEEEKGN